jgi:hypothetical protein
VGVGGGGGGGGGGDGGGDEAARREIINARKAAADAARKSMADASLIDDFHAEIASLYVLLFGLKPAYFLLEDSLALILNAVTNSERCL